MALIPTPILDYTDRDFASLRLRLQGLARSVFPTWTDFNSANFGNLVVELLAYVGDNISFYQDAQAREAFWPTLTRRISAIRLGRLINFTLTGVTKATGVARFSIPAPLLKKVIIPPGTRMRSIDPLTPVSYRTTNQVNAEISVGNTFVDVAAEQTELIEGELFESTGLPNQEFILGRTPYLDGSTSIVANDGSYTEIETFTEVTPADRRRFVVLVDQNDRARIRFGNGTEGKIPEGVINVSYKVSEGAVGNIEPGRLGTIVDTILDEDTDPVAGVTVSNLEKFSGGSDRMTVAQARALAPASLRALTRTVSRTDFETHALEVGGVARALMVTSNEDPAVLENQGFLVIVALGPQLPSGRFEPAIPDSQLLAEVLDKVTVEKPATITFQVNVIAVTFKTIDVSAKVHLKPGAVAVDVDADIRAALDDFFAATLEDQSPNPDIDFGVNLKNSQGTSIAEIAWSDVLNAIRDVPGLRKVDEGANGLLLNGSRTSVTIGLRQFPSLGTVTLINAETSLPLA